MLHYSHTTDRRIRSYPDRSMPERNLVGDLLRLHPSPGPVGCRSIDNESVTVFPSPSPVSISNLFSRGFLVGDAEGLIAATRWIAIRSIDRSADNEIVSVLSFVRARVRASTRGFSRLTKWGTLQRFRRRYAIDRSRTRSTRLSLVPPI